MKIEIIGDGRVFDGTPKQIVMRMKSVSPGAARLSLEEFIAANLAQLGLDMPTGSNAPDGDDLAVAFIDRMIAEGHARLL